MATENDIKGWFLVLQEKAQAIAGADLPGPDREQIRLLADVGLRIAESVVLDLNRIANAMEWVGDSQANRVNR